MGHGTNEKELLIERIREIKRQRKAVILAHNYQRPEVQDIADFSGDSLELSRKAAKTDAEVIVFCGVHFMAETAAILSPDKTVLLPAATAGCPMADMVDAEGLRRLKAEHPAAAVVCYVNSTAEVKAESDLCCTSANAAEVVASIEAQREIIFVPDQYLGGHVERVTGRSLLLWPGYCPTHRLVRPEAIERKRQAHPGAVVLVHPECLPETAAAADQVLSTGGMCRFARESAASTFIVGTEVGILHRLRRENPDKVFIPATEQAVCPNMKKITLETLLDSLERLEHVITVPEEIRWRAERALARMLELGAR